MAEVDPARECDGEGSGPPSLSPVSCIREGHGVATVFCHECVQFYCDICRENHQLFDLMSGHRFGPVDISSEKFQTFQKAAAKNVCAEHKQRFSHLCRTCCCLICWTCWMATHKNHDTEEFVEIARNRQHDYGRLQEDGGDFVSHDNDVLTELLGPSWITTRDYFKDAKTEVKKATQQIRQLADDHEKALLHKAATLRKTAVSVLKQEQEICVKYTKTRSPTCSPLFRSLCADVELNLRTLELIKPEKEISLDYGHRFFVTGMSVLKGFLCITHQHDPNLWLYDTEHSDRTKTLLVPELKAPNGMTVLDHNNCTIVITDAYTGGGRLHFVTISQDLNIANHRFTEISMEVPGHIVFCSETGELLVAPERLSSNICVFNANINPRLQREVKLDILDDTLEVRCITENKGGCLLLCGRIGITTLLSVNQEGKCCHLQVDGVGTSNSFGSFMIKDAEDRLVLLEFGSDRVNLIDPSKGQTHLLLTQESGITKPHCVCIDQSETRLYVAYGLMGHMRARVYNWPPKRSSTPKFQLRVTAPDY